MALGSVAVHREQVRSESVMVGLGVAHLGWSRGAPIRKTIGDKASLSKKRIATIL